MPRIYVIDDDNDLLDVVKSSLRKKGFNVSTFVQWEIANEAIKHVKPQVILLDVFLSGIDGLDVCQKLKSSPYSKHIPILLFSAFPKIAEIAMHDYGADDFIAKPFELNDLVTKLHLILSKGPAT
ncbi:MAG: response regulator [Bacteroidota bacterium]|nr:response regulator [Bacteroidota bacterium]